MTRRLTAALLGTVLAGALGGAASVAGAPTYSLTGTWVSDQPTTTIALVQSANTITWDAEPDDHAWLQHFTGTLTGDTFSGEFSQHAPNDPAHVYTGTLSAQVIDACHFRTIHVLQSGLPDAGGVTFTKTPCPASTEHYAFGFRLTNASIGLSTESHGSVTATGPPGTAAPVKVTSVAAKSLHLVWRLRGQRWAIVLAFTGSGTLNTGIDELDLALAVRYSNVPQCPESASAASSVELAHSYVRLILCGRASTFAIPQGATDWFALR